MSDQSSTRAYGTGSVFQRPDQPGTWYGQWRVEGRRMRRKLGPVKSKAEPNGLTATQARTALRDAMREVTPDEVDRIRSEKRRAGKLIDEVLAAYIADHSDLKAHTTAHDYRQTCRNWFVPFFDGKTVDRITADDVRRLRDRMQTTRLRNHGQAAGAGLSPKSVRNYLTLLSTLLAYAVDRGWATTNVAAKVPRPGDRAEESGELRFFEPHEVTDLIAHALPGAYQQLDRALFLTAAQTGLRLGELLALRWSAVDMLQGVVRVERGWTRGQESSPKSRKRRSVPLPPAVQLALLDLRELSPVSDGDGLVFGDPRTGTPLSGTPLRRRYNAARDAAGLAGLPFHSLRHSFGTALARAGWPVGDVQALMGHADLATTQIYMHYAPRHDQAARIAAAFAAADPRTATESEGRQLEAA